MRWKSLFIQLSFISILLLYTFPSSAEQSGSLHKDYSLATDIADHYLRSFPSEGEDPVEEPSKKKKAHKIRPAKLSEKVKREVVFNRIFTKSYIYDLVQRKMAPILNEYAWGDLKLFYGTTSTPDYHLIGHINRTTTTTGECVLATMLVTPTSNIKELQEKQQILKAMLEDQAAVQQLKHSLQCYQEAEQSVLSLWTPSDPFYSYEYEKYMNRRFYFKNNPVANKSAASLEFKKRFFRDFLGIQMCFIYPFVMAGILDLVLLMPTGAPSKLRRDLYLGSIPIYSFYHAYTERRNEMGASWWVFPAIFNSVYAWNVYVGISRYREYSSVLRNLALRMADIHTFIVAVTEINQCVSSSPALQAAYGTRLAHIQKLLAQAEEDTELGRLMSYLQQLSYKSWSYFFSNAGQLLASYKLFVEHKDEFVDAMYELGQLDAFVGIATLMQEAKDSEAPHVYVFTQFLDRSQKDRPFIKLNTMWNPFLDPKVAVGNTVEMDAASGGVRNMILTGPNAGGKSTFLTGVTTSLLLSQTFGIAPAKEAVITPFDKINTYIDIADDIAAGKSLFMAEVDRAQKHLRILSTLQRTQFSFTIFDEPFSGTNPIEGSAAEYSILEAIAEHSNTMNIVATHYPIVMLLEKNIPGKGFANYKVYITHKKGDKKINYTYKVVPGRSTQAIAIDILEEQGYDTRLLKRAREIIAHPERYKANF